MDRETKRFLLKLLAMLLISVAMCYAGFLKLIIMTKWEIFRMVLVVILTFFTSLTVVLAIIFAIYKNRWRN